MLRQDVKVSEEAQNRGGCLSTLLALSFIGNIGGVIGFIGDIFRSGSTQFFNSSAPVWYLVVFIILSVLNLVSLLAIWKWKKWGIFALIASIIIGIGINLSIDIPVLVALVPLVALVILVVLIKPRWHLFN